MSIYKNYIELSVISTKHLEKAKRNPHKVADIYRRTISTAINLLHQLSKKKSVGGYAISIEDMACTLPDIEPVRVQSTIRIFTKKPTALEHLRSVLSAERFFVDFFHIGAIKNTPEQPDSYLAYMRVRMPTVKKQAQSAQMKKEVLDRSPDCNFIYLMPSSSVRGSKRLIRYYYRVVEMQGLKTAQFSKPDGYGFSRSNRLCVVAKLR